MFDTLSDIKQGKNMRTVFLLNSAILTTDGTYTMETITTNDAKVVLRAFLKNPTHYTIKSTIGYPDTAKIMSEALNYDVQVSRESINMNSGDVAIVAKLKYRVKHPDDKGRFIPHVDDFIWQIIHKK